MMLPRQSAVALRLSYFEPLLMMVSSSRCADVRLLDAAMLQLFRPAPRGDVHVRAMSMTLLRQRQR